MTVADPPLLEARRLRKSYRQGKVVVEALSGVDLAIGAREFVVIAGISGSGKSTLLHLLGGLDQPDQGEVLFAGTDLAARTESERTELRRRQIGFVFQAFNLVPVLSAYENVEYGLWLGGVAKDERRQRVVAALEAVGLAERMSHRPDHLSGGERQRVALARALVQEPRVILADEPTASLDSRTSGEMLHLLLELNATRGATFVFATHDSALVAHAPRVVHLVDGRIVDDLARR
ncbi:MAG TPA: ABC transporter ATP-binding protein [Thermoanaerobaculia bacterium]|jgi:putative ABC transport system ATP-binding protein|nr:ABC transporter ATP-binding protein [Thermoanaerobaculia bacterium]